MAERGEKRKRKTPLIMIFNICINTTFAYIRLLLYLIGIFWLHFLLFSTLMILVFSLVLLLSFLRGKGPSRNCQCEWVSGSVTKKLRNCNISYFFFRINKELRTGRVFCNFFGGLWKSWWNCWGLGVMLEGDSADTCPGKFPLMLMGGRAEGLACTDPEARNPIGTNGNFCPWNSKGPITNIFWVHYFHRKCKQCIDYYINCKMFLLLLFLNKINSSNFLTLSLSCFSLSHPKSDMLWMSCDRHVANDCIDEFANVVCGEKK